MTMKRQHFPRGTVSAAILCNKCDKVTQHRVDAPKLGPCLECIAKLDEAAEKERARGPVAQQKGLFPA